jgi:hypothetical protein
MGFRLDLSWVNFTWDEAARNARLIRSPPPIPRSDRCRLDGGHGAVVDCLARAMAAQAYLQHRPSAES